MSKKTLYPNFSSWPVWDKHREKCRELHNEKGYKERTIKSLQKKVAALEQEAKELRLKIKEKCSHPLTHLAVRDVNESLCEWNEHWVKVYSCELCNQDLYRTKKD